MKKKLISSISALLMCCSTLFGAVSCGGTTGTTSKESEEESVVESVVESESLSGSESATESESSTEVPKGMITASPLSLADLGEGFDAKYIPDTKQIRALTGKIDVCLDFEGTQAGWQALADEYERLQGGGVQVNIDTSFAGSRYAERLNTELAASKTDWDIVEGNLGYGKTAAKCIDMYPLVASVNPYCGENVKWNSVLQEAAYKTKEADNSGVSQIMNTEIMQTCWFINDVAFQAAVENGYRNADGLAEYPITWDDLINLCSAMELAGYTNPLGITLCNASIDSLQFTWLLRVYGDYYYRQFYQYIMSGTAGTTWDNYDPTAEVPENLAGYGHQYAKILALLFNKECDWGPGYVGFQSEVYRDMVTNIAKMKGHLILNPATTEFGELRDQFEAQSNGLASAQILLDYQGFGIRYNEADTEGFELGYFDYPTMVSGYYTSGPNKGKQIVSEDTITRDIGGNGGFLSVVNQLGDANQNNLNKDFVKFVLSPYGQTVYYKGLAAAGKVPKGLSTVKNELVVIPSEWVDFFEESNETITFSGDVDANNFLSWGVRYTCGYTEGQSIIKSNWRNLLMTGLSAEQTLTPAAFCAYWAQAAEKDAHAMTVDYRWPNDVWTNPNYQLG